MHIRILVIAVATAAMFGSVKAEQAADDHLGTVHFPISCNGVQAKFDRGCHAPAQFLLPRDTQGISGGHPGRSELRHRLLGSGDERAA